MLPCAQLLSPYDNDKLGYQQRFPTKQVERLKSAINKILERVNFQEYVIIQGFNEKKEGEEDGEKKENLNDGVKK